MGINVCLENEKCQAVRVVTDPHNYLKRALEISGQNLPLLRYVDPYGHTVFNYIQAVDVLAELDTLALRLVDETSLHQLREVREIVAVVKGTRHMYVRFSGD